MDPLGKAVADYFENKNGENIIVHSSMFDDDEMSVSNLFRTYAQMPYLEKIALRETRGKILDIGGAAGAHALYLQSKKKEVTSIDISPLAVETMKKRGVKNVFLSDFYDFNSGTYDTILLLMNGTGIMRTIENIPIFFQKAKTLMNKDAQILVDSSDLIYLYENEDGSVDLDLSSKYYGEVTFSMSYKDQNGEEFPWLYLDFNTLSYYAESNGLSCELVKEGNHYDYLARLMFK